MKGPLPHSSPAEVGLCVSTPPASMIPGYKVYYPKDLRNPFTIA